MHAGDHGKVPQAPGSAHTGTVSGEKPRPVYKMKRTGFRGLSFGSVAPVTPQACAPNAAPTKSVLSGSSTSHTTPSKSKVNLQDGNSSSRPESTMVFTKSSIANLNSSVTSATPATATPSSTANRTMASSSSTPDMQLRSSNSSKKGSIPGHIVPSSVQKVFASALDETPYRQIYDDVGNKTTTQGALLPPGYTKSNNPEFPWICPVRSCRKLFASVSGIGGHFNTTHHATRLNDNLDGTLTDLGRYVEAMPGDGSSHVGGYAKPPLIVSKGEMSIGEHPIVDSGMQHARERLGKHERQSAGGGREKGVIELLDSGSDSEQLSTSKRLMPQRGVPRATEQLQKLVKTGEALEATKQLKTPAKSGQAIEWADSTRTYKQFSDESGSLVDVHGALIPNGYQLLTLVADRPWICPLRSCRRLFKNSVALGYHFTTLHRGDQLNDNLDGTFSVVEKRTSHPPAVVSRGTMDPEEVLVEPTIPIYQTGSRKKLGAWLPISAINKVEEANKEEVGEEDTPSLAVSSRPRRSARHHAEGASNAQVTSRKREREYGDSSTSEVGLEQKRSKIAAPNQSGRSKSSWKPAPVDYTVGQIIPEEALQMEDWEAGDGRILATNIIEGPPENIAFSGSYLATNQNVQVHENVTYLTAIIISGQTYKIRPDENKLRIVSLTSSKLRVIVGEEPEFVIGAHGMFKVKAGSSASIQNRSYADVVVHITSVDLE